MNRTILTISGLDASCTSGTAADIKTFQTFRVYGAAAITSILVQNTQGIQAIHPVPMEILGQQVEAIATDMAVHGVKVGMVATAANAQMIATLLDAFQLAKTMVLDPMLHSAAGAPLLDDKAVEVVREKLLPMAYVVTPNVLEAQVLTGVAVADMNGAKEAAKALFDRGARNVVITGGHLEGTRAMDLWYDGARYHVFDALKVPTKNTLGIGCTFSAILAALLVKGLGLGEAIDKAKQYIAKAVQHPFQIGKGGGPLNHTIPM